MARISVSETLRGSLNLLGNNPILVLPPLLNLAWGIFLIFLIFGGWLAFLSPLISKGPPVTTPAHIPPGFYYIIPSAVLVIVVTIFVLALSQAWETAMLVNLFEEGRVDVGRSFRMALDRLPAIVLAWIIAAIIAGLVALAFGVAIALLFQGGFTILLGAILAFVGLIVLMVLILRFIYIPQAAVKNKAGPMASIKLSWRFTSGMNFWATLLIWIILMVISLIPYIGALINQLLNPLFFSYAYVRYSL